MSITFNKLNDDISIRLVGLTFLLINFYKTQARVFHEYVTIFFFFLSSSGLETYGPGLKRMSS